MTSYRRKILKDISWLGSAQYISQAVGVLVAIATSRIVGPENIGIWSAISVILPFTLYSDLGVTAGTAWRIPYLRGEGKLKDIDNLRSDSFLSINTTALLVCGGVLFYTFFLLKEKTVLFYTGYMCLIFLILAQQINGYFNAVLRADYKFDLIFQSKFLAAFSSIFILLPLCFIYNIYGLIIGYAVAAWIPLIYLIIKSKYRYFFSFDFKSTYITAKIGIPITLVGFFYITMMNIDKLLVVKYMPYKEIGFYKLAATFSSLMAMVSGTIAFVLSPYMLEKYGQHHDPKQLETLVIPPSLIVAYFMSLIIGILYLIVPSILYVLLPSFYPAAKTAQLLIISFFFISVATLSGTFLVNIKKSGYVMAAQWIMIICIFALGPFVLSRVGLEGMALAIIGNYFFYSLLIIYFSLKALGYLKRKFLKFIFSLYSPFLYTFGVIVFLTYLSHWLNLNPEKIIGHALFLCFIFTLLFLPWLAFAYKSNTLIKEIVKGA